MAKKKPTTLGPTVMTFHVQPLRWRHVLSLFLPYCLALLGLVGYGYWRAIYGYTNYGPAAAQAWGQPWFLSAALLTLPLLLYALWRIYRSHTWVRVHKNGLLIHRPPSRVVKLPWDQITGLRIASSKRSFLGWKSTIRHRPSLHTRQGKSIPINPKLKGIETLIRILKKQVYARLLPKYKQAFRAGRPLHFGPVSISKSLLSYQDKEIPWSYIQGITALDGNLVIRLSPQQALKVPTQQIQNMDLLVQIIQDEVR